MVACRVLALPGLIPAVLDSDLCLKNMNSVVERCMR